MLRVRFPDGQLRGPRGVFCALLTRCPLSEASGLALSSRGRAALSGCSGTDSALAFVTFFTRLRTPEGHGHLCLASSSRTLQCTCQLFADRRWSWWDRAQGGIESMERPDVPLPFQLCRSHAVASESPGPTLGAAGDINSRLPPHVPSPFSPG